MTGLDRNQTPKTRPMPQKRTALVASLDIGTSKIACMIARLKPCPRVTPCADAAMPSN